MLKDIVPVGSSSEKSMTSVRNSNNKCSSTVSGSLFHSKCSLPTTSLTGNSSKPTLSFTEKQPWKFLTIQFKNSRKMVSWSFLTTIPANPCGVVLTGTAMVSGIPKNILKKSTLSACKNLLKGTNTCQESLEWI